MAQAADISEMDTPEQRRGILAGGNWIIDYVKILDTWPNQDTLANIIDESWANGGSPYNILKALRKLGVGFPLDAVGLIGKDANGDRILADCRKHKINTDQLQMTSEAPTSYTDVMTERSTGRRTFFHQRGANALLSPEHFDFSGSWAQHFHLGYLLLLDLLDEADPEDGGRPRAAKLLARAKAAGMETSLDCVSENSDRFGQVVVPVLPQVDVLFANDFEAEQLAGMQLRNPVTGALDRASVEQAGQALLGMGVRDWVLLHFPEGAYGVTREGEMHWEPGLSIPGELIRGSAGAGDAFAAGVLAVRLEGGDLSKSMRLGVCAAASSLLHATCSEGILSLVDCLELRESYAPC